MVPNHRKIEALKVVLDGGTLSEAGAAIGVGQSRARDLISRICREFGLPREIEYIRSNPKKYLDKINGFKDNPKMALRSVLIHNLIRVLKLNDVNELTPRYLSNLTASQLMSVGITSVAILEIQEWLSSYQLSLKVSVPKNENDIKKVKQAIAILEVFQFDTNLVNEQLSHFLASN